MKIFPWLKSFMSLEKAASDVGWNYGELKFTGSGFFRLKEAFFSREDFELFGPKRFEPSVIVSLIFLLTDSSGFRQCFRYVKHNSPMIFR